MNKNILLPNYRNFVGSPEKLREMANIIEEKYGSRSQITFYITGNDINVGVRYW
jgi:hypothetical protein